MKRLDGKRILLVDDEAGIRDSFYMYLHEGKGAQVTTAEDGAQALELYQPGQFDCVVTDYKMPNLCGDALAREIKSAQPTQRIVMVSGYTENLKVNGAMPWYLDALLPKPLDKMEDLVEAIDPT